MGLSHIFLGCQVCWGSLKLSYSMAGELEYHATPQQCAFYLTEVIWVQHSNSGVHSLLGTGPYCDCSTEKTQERRGTPKEIILLCVESAGVRRLWALSETLPRQRVNPEQKQELWTPTVPLV